MVNAWWPCLAATIFCVTPGLACDIPISADGRVAIATLAEALDECAGVLDSAPVLPSAEMVDFGSYELVYSGEGDARKATGLKHADWLRQLPLRADLIFGFRAIIAPDLDPDSGDVTIEIVTHHPPAPGAAPESAKIEISRKTSKPGSLEVVAYVISTDEDMTPGLWRMEVRQGGQVVISQRFLLTR